MDKLAACDHFDCLKSSLDCDRLMRVLLDGRACLHGLLETERETARCLAQAFPPQSQPVDMRRVAPRQCDHQPKAKICYNPACRNQNDRISCHNCALTLHNSCVSPNYVGELADHREDFAGHRLGSESVRILQMVDQKWQETRGKLRDFLIGVERRFKSEVLFSVGFDVQLFADRLAEFEVVKREDGGFEFAHKNKQLIGDFFGAAIPRFVDEFFAQVTALRHSFKSKVSAEFVTRDVVSRSRHREFILELKKSVNERIAEINEARKAGRPVPLDDGGAERAVDSFWGVEPEDRESPQVVEWGVGGRMAEFVEAVLREDSESHRDQRPMDPHEIETTCNRGEADGGEWCCEVHSRWPAPGDDLAKWLVVRLRDKWAFLYQENKVETSRSN